MVPKINLDKVAKPPIQNTKSASHYKSNSCIMKPKLISQNNPKPLNTTRASNKIRVPTWLLADSPMQPPVGSFVSGSLSQISLADTTLPQTKRNDYQPIQIIEVDDAYSIST